MFKTLTQWLGMLAAPPVLFVLLGAVALSSACLVTPPFRLELLDIRRTSLRQRLSDPLNERERNRVCRSLWKVERHWMRVKKLVDIKSASIRDAAILELLPTARRLAGARLLGTGRCELQKIALNRYKESCRSEANPVVLAALSRLWQMRHYWSLLRNGFLALGLPIGEQLLREAVSDVSNGGVAGLLLGIVASQYGGSFIVVIANSVTLGAFIGLGVTAYRTGRRAFTVAWDVLRSGPGSRKSMMVAASLSLLIYLGGVAVAHLS